MSTHIFEYIGKSDRFGYGKYLDLEIIIDNTTNYINATKLCQLGDKRLRNWVNNVSSKELIKCFNDNELRLNSSVAKVSYEIEQGDLKGMSRKDQEVILGTYYHEDIVVHIAQWISPAFTFKVSQALSNYKTTLNVNLPSLNTGLPSFITDKINVNMSLNALNDLIGHMRKEITPIPKPKMIKIESYEEILSRKVRDLYSKIMPPDYYEHIKDIEHPEDIREVLICLAGKLGIDIIVKEGEKYGIKSYEVYFQWNKLPLLLGYTDDERQAQIIAGDWKYKKWVDPSMLVTYNDLKSNVGFGANIATDPSIHHTSLNMNVRSGANIATSSQNEITSSNTFDVRSDIIATSSSRNNISSNTFDGSRAIKRIDAVYVQIDGLTELLCRCKLSGHKNDMLQIWIDTTLTVARYFSNVASEAHNEYNANYTKQLKDLHYREIAAITEIPIPTLSKGYLYIGTDPTHLSKCQYKLGMTSKPVKTRLSSSQTTNPDYYYIYSVETKEPNEAEHILHTMLTKIGMKVTKEWYQLPSEEVAITLVDKVAEIVGCLYNDEYIEKFIQSVRALQLR